jgi:hypothetical protein
VGAITFCLELLGKSEVLLHVYRGLVNLTFPIKSALQDNTLQPAFVVSARTRNECMADAAPRPAVHCPFEALHLRQCLELEIVPPTRARLRGLRIWIMCGEWWDLPESQKRSTR